MFHTFVHDWSRLLSMMNGHWDCFGHHYCMSQKKITIGLSASITFKVYNKSKYNFRLWNYNFLPAFCRKPHYIWSSSYAEIWIFIKHVTRPFPPSFDKMQNHNAQESIHASFKWYERGRYWLAFIRYKYVVPYFIFSVYDQLIFFILVFILHIAYQCNLFGLFLQNERNYECKYTHIF